MNELSGVVYLYMLEPLGWMFMAMAIFAFFVALDYKDAHISCQLPFQKMEDRRNLYKILLWMSCSLCAIGGMLTFLAPNASELPYPVSRDIFWWVSGSVSSLAFFLAIADRYGSLLLRLRIATREQKRKLRSARICFVEAIMQPIERRQRHRARRSPRKH